MQREEERSAERREREESPKNKPLMHAGGRMEGGIFKFRVWATPLLVPTWAEMCGRKSERV